MKTGLILLTISDHAFYPIADHKHHLFFGSKLFIRRVIFLPSPIDKRNAGKFARRFVAWDQVHVSMATMYIDLVSEPLIIEVVRLPKLSNGDFEAVTDTEKFVFLLRKQFKETLHFSQPSL